MAETRHIRAGTDLAEEYARLAHLLTGHGQPTTARALHDEALAAHLPNIRQRAEQAANVE